jgi:hypothetical protein
MIHCGGLGRSYAAAVMRLPHRRSGHRRETPAADDVDLAAEARAIHLPSINSTTIPTMSGSRNEWRRIDRRIFRFVCRSLLKDLLEPHLAKLRQKSVEPFRF